MNISEFIKRNTNVRFLLLIIITSWLLIFIDAKYYKSRNQKKEARIAKGLGYFYIFLILVMYAITKMM